ncbi:MAG: hypothetical protein LBL17_02865 [Coxiellaceae bacterium]|jgi:type VI secretion system protein ImpL|nr:hypothetical protein [Coxiellaceae bacterium]
MKWNLKFLSHKESEQAKQELKILEEDIVSAKNFLHKNCHTYFQGKKKIPIYLILGPTHFGKTTLLSQTGLDLIDVEHQTLNNITPTKYCSFWFSKDTLYIDTAGTYTKPDITKPRNNLIWQGFIKLLQKHFGKNSIAGTLIILDLPAIIEDKSLFRKTLFCISERVYEMAALIKKLYTYIIFTKCDRIAGFNEFFAMLSIEEWSQPFGISFNHCGKKLRLIPAFEDKFNTLLKHLNNRIVENLHRSIYLQEHSLIKTFPSQLEYLRPTLIETISKIPHSRQILLSGIYFTSSIQNSYPINQIKTATFRMLNLQEKPLYCLEASNNHSYFVEELFKETIQIEQQPQHTTMNLAWFNINQLYALILAGSIITISSIFGYQSYRENLNAINQTKLSLQTQNIANPAVLYATINQLKQNSSSPRLTFGINKIKRLQSSLLQAYRDLLSHILSSQLENYLTTINTKELNNVQKLYSGLQVYLMLGTPEKLNPAYVKWWFNEYQQEIYGASSQQNNLQTQFDIIFQQKFKTALNQQVIAHCRENLNNVPSPQLIYCLLENIFAEQNLKGTIPQSISAMYLRKNFHKVYNDLIPSMVNIPPRYNWVLGNQKISLTTDSNTIKNLQDIYVEKYIATWKNTLRLEKKNEFKNWSETTKYSKTISTIDSPLMNTLKQIKYNTDIDNPPAQLTKEINIQLPGLHDLNLEELQENLNKLIHYVETMVQHSHDHKAASTTMGEYLQDSTNNPLTTFKTFVNTQPPWLQTYLQSISNNIWQILADATYDSINQIWNQTIIPKYKATLENKYPLFKNSKDDIKLEDFNSFFGPNGLMDNFFNQYLKPLVNTNSINWSWKEFNGQKINYSSTFLEIFLRAATIQKMFYASKMPFPKLEFALTPIIMTPNTQNFTLHIDGQKISFANEESKIKHLVWPGPQPGSVTMSFVNNQGKYFSFSEFGPWAWFRILDKANVTTNNNTKYFELTFDLNGNAVKYSLSTKTSLNPFIPEIINNFRCTEQQSN